MAKRVIIVENSQVECDHLTRWVQEVSKEKQEDVHIEPIVCNHLDEFKARMDEEYASDPKWTDLILLDVMFRPKDGVKQLEGGVELWKYMIGEGYHSQVGAVIAVTHGSITADDFPASEPPVVVVTKGSRHRVKAELSRVL